METALLLASIAIIALLYSSVGHGGASGYLAIMAIAGISPELMKSSALILNLFVSSIAFFSFYKAGFFKWEILWPFIISSIPASYFGAMLPVNASMYHTILSICLLIAVTWMLFKPKDRNIQPKNINYPLAVGIGVIFGFISGIVGIGGGILLSPFLIIMRWANVKQAAGVSSAFIFLNSLSGLSGLIKTGVAVNPDIIPFIAAAMIGGLTGSLLGSFRFSVITVKSILSIVLLFASIKIILF